MKKINYLVILLIVLNSCSEKKTIQDTDNSKVIDSIFKQILAINVESFKSIDADRRSSELITLRYHFEGDSSGGGILFPAMREENTLKIKFGDTWLKVDSIEFNKALNDYLTKMQLSKNKFVNDFNIMEKLNATRIVSGKDDALVIEIDNIKFYHVFDPKLQEEYDTIKGSRKLENNWWVLSN